MPKLVLDCDVVSVKPPSSISVVQPDKAQVLVIPVKYVEGAPNHPIVVGASGSIDYSSLNDGTLVFEY